MWGNGSPYCTTDGQEALDAIFGEQLGRISENMYMYILRVTWKYCSQVTAERARQV